MSAPNYWTKLRHRKISRRTMLGASAKAGVGAAGLALVGCGGDDDDDGGASDAAAAEAAAAAGDSSAAAAAAERAAAAAEEAAAAAAAAGDAGAAAVAEAAAAAAAAAAEAAREAGADQAQAAAEAAAAAAAAAEDAAAAAREAAAAATAGADGSATAGYDLNAKLRIAFGAFTSTLDPHTQAGFGGHAAANLLHFDTVFARGFDGLARNGGTFDFEFVDANEKLLLTQNPGWNYQDGTPVTLEEVQFNIERTGGRWAGDPNFVGRAGNLVGIEDIEMVDATAGKLSMDPPSPGVPNILVRLLLTPRAHVEDQGAEGMANSPIGHGPFQFIDWTQDQVINSTRFDGYGNGRDFDHMKRLPWVKDLESRLFPEEQARLAALENNEIDIATQIIPDLARTYEDDPDFVVWYHSAQRGLHIQIPKHLLEDPVNGGPNPWRDLRVRAAANLAVNQDVLINNIMTGRENRTYTLAVGQAGHDGSEGPISDLDWGYDPDRARALLAEAGYPDGFDFEIRYPQGLYTNVDSFIQAVAGMLTEVGIRTRVEIQEISQYFSDLREDATDVLFLFPQAAGLDPLVSITENARRDAVFAHRIEELCDPDAFNEIEDYFDAAAAEFDEEKRNDLLNKGTRRHYEQASWIYLFELVQPQVARGNLEWPQFQKKPSFIEFWNVRAREV